MFTTGFFKSALEECADINMKKDWRFIQTSEKERIDLTHEESKKQKELLKTELYFCDTKYAISDIRHTICTSTAQDNHNTNYKWKIIRKISPEENKKNYKKFISKSLKKKMKDPSYIRLYDNCVKYKKSKPEVFKAQYD